MCTNGFWISPIEDGNLSLAQFLNQKIKLWLVFSCYMPLSLQTDYFIQHLHM